MHSEQVVDVLAFKREWLSEPLGLKPLYSVVIETVGDSTTPTIESGDSLLVDMSAPQLRRYPLYSP